VIGILLLITAVKQWRKEDDPDAPPPKWMATISGLSTAKALGMGALLVAIAAKQWVFTLSAIGVHRSSADEPGGECRCVSLLCPGRPVSCDRAHHCVRGGPDPLSQELGSGTGLAGASTTGRS